MNINDTMKEVHDLAIDKGWYEQPKSPLEALMLIVSEISEAAEEVRKGTPAIYQIHDTGSQMEPSKTIVAFGHPLFKMPDTVKWIWGSDSRKPEGEAVELADAVIRIFDYCEYRGFNLEEAIRIKHAYNKTRSYKHGNKLL